MQKENQTNQQRVFRAVILKQHLIKKLLALRDSISGKKILMIDSQARNLIDKIIDKKQLLSYNNFEQFGIANLEVAKIPYDFNNILIILTPTITSMQTIVQLYQKNKSQKGIKYHLLTWPQSSPVCQQYIQERCCIQSFQFKDFAFNFIPIDQDIYSIQVKCFKELYIDQNFQIYNTIAESIYMLQDIFGKPKNISGKGDSIKSIFEILKIKDQQTNFNSKEGSIEHLFVFDRSIDFLTPLLRPRTYEGLADQFSSMTGNFQKFKSGFIQTQPNNKPTNSIRSDSDHIFKEVKDMSIEAARNTLKIKLQKLAQAKQQARKILNIKEKCQAVKRIQNQYSLLEKHINRGYDIQQQMKTIGFNKQMILVERCLEELQCNQILQYYRCLIPFKTPLQKLMRPLCVCSLVQKGIKQQIYRQICSQIIQSYGGQHIISLNRMSKIGLFNQKGYKKMRFRRIKQCLNLVSNELTDQNKPQDMSYVYRNYSPIIPKLVELILDSNLKKLMEVFDKIPGFTLLPQKIDLAPKDQKAVCIVYFVGGVTYGQIAALRFLGKRFNKEMVIATTEILNGSVMLKSICFNCDSD